MTRGVAEKDRWAICQRCNRAFERRGPGQRYCLNCKPIAYREYAREQNKAYYHRNPKKAMESIKRTRAKRPDHYREHRKNQAKRRERIRFTILDHYSNHTFRCVCCGEHEVDFLTIDHIAGNGSKHRREIFGNPRLAGGNFYQWLWHQKLPSGFQVLCSNCNFSKGKHGVCIHTSGPTVLASSP